MQSDSWTSRTSRLLSALLPPTVCICARDGHSSCDPAACLGVSASAASGPPPEAVVVSSEPLEQMSGHKSSPDINLPGAQLIVNQSARLGFYTILSSV